MEIQNRKGRRLDGVLLLDKPAGCSSNRALQVAKRLLGARKAGHSGTLDPFATGLLPLLFGEATKFGRFVVDSKKIYQATGFLGSRTDTGDREGVPVEAQPVPELSRESLEKALEVFRGEIKQLPPMYSALKHQGQRLYELARQGLEVERKVRVVQIHDLLLRDFGTETLELEICCSKGTYIRTLIEDIAQALGTVAYTRELRRTRVGDLSIDDGISLDRLENESPEHRCAHLLPLDVTVATLPPLRLDMLQARRLRLGQSVDADEEDLNEARIYDHDGDFMGVGRVSGGQLTPIRLLAAEQQH